MSRRPTDGPPVPGGLAIVDKPAGWTSHDVVGRMRKLAGTRRVGHAGTLDPMATGVLVIGVERATKLLGHLLLTDKGYTGTIRLGQSSTTDDAEGDVSTGADPGHLTEPAVLAEMAALTGEIDQVPAAVSAIKVAGKRAYARVRDGEQVELAARRVTVNRFALTGFRPGDQVLDLDVEVECTSGTYVRALARDLGAALGVGGHLTGLRRTRVGPYTLDQAKTLDELVAEPVPIALSAAVAGVMPRRDLDAEQARIVGHGGKLPAIGIAGPYGVFGPDGMVVAVVTERAGTTRCEVVLTPS